MAPYPDVIVIGAGVIGLSAAVAVQGRGLSVTVLDREGPAAGASAAAPGGGVLPGALPGAPSAGASAAWGFGSPGGSGGCGRAPVNSDDFG